MVADNAWACRGLAAKARVWSQWTRSARPVALGSSLGFRYVLRDMNCGVVGLMRPRPPSLIVAEFRAARRAPLFVGHAVRHVAAGNVLGRRVDVRALIVEKNVGAEG